MIPPAQYILRPLLLPLPSQQTTLPPTTGKPPLFQKGREIPLLSVEMCDPPLTHIDRGCDVPPLPTQLYSHTPGREETMACGDHITRRFYDCSLAITPVVVRPPPFVVLCLVGLRASEGCCFDVLTLHLLTAEPALVAVVIVTSSSSKRSSSSSRASKQEKALTMTLIAILQHVEIVVVMVMLEYSNKGHC